MFVKAEGDFIDRAFSALAKAVILLLILGVLTLITVTVGVLPAIGILILYGFVYGLITEGEDASFGCGYVLGVISSMILMGSSMTSIPLKIAGGFLFFVFIPVAVFRS
ncbi:hypothetical protein JW911_02095 [Candidatus Peregrinibacteria bacterium]|nr:hypothetical protein [Candidatus Peregrinibacteria bacterium]